MIRKCVFHNASVSAGTTDVSSTLSLQVDGVTDVTVSQTSFQDNLRNAQRVIDAQAIGISLGSNERTPRNFSAVAVLIEDCEFVSDGLLLGGGVSIDYGTLSIGSNVTILNSLFRGYAACGDCVKFTRRGGAFRFGPINNAASDCINFRHNSLRFDNCTFLDNSAGRGGAIAIESGCNGQTDVKVLRSSFLDNRALSNTDGDGGAILFEQFKSNIGTGDTLLIDGCSFNANKATKSGGAISVGGCASQQRNPEVMVAVVLNDSHVAANSAPVDGQLSVSLARTIQISNTIVIQTMSGPSLQQSTFETHGVGGDVGSLVTITNSHILCGPGERTRIANSSISGQLSAVTASLVTVTCETCAQTTYNLFTEALQFNASSALQPSTFECHKCPIGSRFNCTGPSVGTAPGFWGVSPIIAKASTLVNLHQCPNYYCCDKTEGCHQLAVCTHNRTGVMCGACNDGFVHAFALHGACVPADVCSSTQVWIGNLLVLVGACALVIYVFKRTTTTTDGMFGVLVSFFNVAYIVASNTVVLAPSTSQEGGFSDFLHAVFSLFSGLIEPHSHSIAYCPLESMTSFQKVVMPLTLPALLVSLWAIVSGGVVMFKNRRRVQSNELLADDTKQDHIRRQFSYRVCASLVTLLDFSLVIVVGVTVSLLNPVHIDGLDGGESCRLWKAGDVSCSANITASAALLLMVTLATPAAFHLWQRFRPESVLGVAVADVYQSAMSPNAKHYGFAMMARRVLVAMANAFLTDVDLRLMAIRTVLLQSFALRLFFHRPFLSKWVDFAEAPHCCCCSPSRCCNGHQRTQRYPLRRVALEWHKSRYWQWRWCA